MESKRIIENPMDIKPHVVLLGAGASRAAFPTGDISGKRLPVMNDLVETIGITALLEKFKVVSTGNFEIIYSQLKNYYLKKKIESHIVDYFYNLFLPNEVTIYDQLLLSLREKDAIFTFNWDPFLFDAYQRNRHIVPLPQIFFLHGNVRIGACKNCDNWGMKSQTCCKCNIKYEDVPLLYPIKKKNYFGKNRYTAMCWESAKLWFAEAFTISIFGYGAPSSDIEAVECLKKAWFAKSLREFEHVEVIDILSEDQLTQKWAEFIPTNHLLPQEKFENSRLWRWPRRSCEALYYPMAQGLPCEDFPLPITNNLTELHDVISKIACFENNVGKLN